MDKTQQRIKIAEACGWTNITGSGKAPNDKQFILKDGEIWTSLSSPIPDYLNDLNAMHEAEKVLDGNLLYRYGNKLDDITRIEEIMEMAYVDGPEAGMYPELFRATAKQRAEAFLRTLGLWGGSE